MSESSGITGLTWLALDLGCTSWLWSSFSKPGVALALYALYLPAYTVSRLQTRPLQPADARGACCRGWFDLLDPRQCAVPTE